jgi:hypothetical protein
MVKSRDFLSLELFQCFKEFDKKSAIAQSMLDIIQIAKISL